MWALRAPHYASLATVLANFSNYAGWAIGSWVEELGCTLDWHVGLEVGLDVAWAVGWAIGWAVGLDGGALAWAVEVALDVDLEVGLEVGFVRLVGRWGWHVGLDVGVSLSIGLVRWPGWPRCASLAIFFNCTSLPTILANRPYQPSLPIFRIATV